jgi:hypothetical protein
VENPNVLQHLLKVEAEAASLAKDAAEEANKRLAEAEKQNRLLYDEQYAQKTAVLEAAYKADIAVVKDVYQKQLGDFYQKLDGIKTDFGNFSRLLESLLFEIQKS